MRVPYLNCLALVFLCLFKEVSDGSDSDSIVQVFTDDWLDTPCVVCILVFIALHRVGLTRTSLSVSKDSRMKAIKDLLDEALNLKVIKDLLLAHSLSQNLVKPKTLLLHGVVVSFVWLV